MINLKTFKITPLLFLISLILGLSAFLTTSVFYLDSTDWCVLFIFPLIYWIGLIFLGAAILMSSIKNNLTVKVSLCILALIFLYVHLIPTIIIKPESLSVFSLWPSSESTLIISSGHISIGDPRFLMDYSSWPFSTIFTAIITMISATPLSELASGSQVLLYASELAGFSYFKNLFENGACPSWFVLFLCSSCTSNSILVLRVSLFPFFCFFYFFLPKKDRG